ncbi:histidine phosphatase family protein [Pseudomonas fluorescens]|nr:histidine phosphatase family protein [Pseudomonas fluorescens]
MKYVRLIRHGESAANAGQATLDHSTIPLTPKGFEQAHLVALSFNYPPALIVASPFTRAHSTAMATAAVFPHVPFETWPIQEFTYLEPARCTGTTVADRREWVEAYWAKADPGFTDGEGAESFLVFIARAQSFLKCLAEHPAQHIVAYSHGQFINAVAWLIERKPLGIYGEAMVDWRQYEIANHVPNCGECLLSKDPDDAGWRVSRSVLEEPRMDATWRVPGRAYQVTRNPERLLIEERAETLAAAGYPPPDADTAMYAEERLKLARAAADSLQVGSVSDSTAGELLAREVCQVLREVTFERRTMAKVGQASWDEVYAGHLVVNVEGWHISIYNDCDTLDHCVECISPDGRRWSFDSGDRFGTDPVALLSTWEHQALERLLKAL